MKTKRKYHTKHTKKQTKKHTKITGIYESPPNITTINGYKVLLLHQPSSEILHISCKVFGGAYLESENISGEAHFLEHLITFGWNKCFGSTCDKLTNLGVSFNAKTGEMYTEYFVTGLKQYYDIMLKYITSILLKPDITLQRFTKEKAAIKTELLRIMKTNEWKINKEMAKNIYNNKSHGIINFYDIKKLLDNVDSITLSSLKEKFKKVYNKHCMLFIVSGNFNKIIIQNKLQKYLKNTDCQMCLYPVTSKLNCFSFKSNISYISDKSSKSTQIYIAFPINLHFYDKNFKYIEFICSILGEGVTSLLLSHLRFKLNLIYAINVSYNTNLCGTTIIFSTIVNNNNVLRVIQEILKLLQLYSNKIIPEKTFLSFKKNYITANINYCKNSPVFLKNFYDVQYFYQLTNKNKKIYTIKEYFNQINIVKSSTIKDCIKEWFNPSNVVITYYGPKEIKTTSLFKVINYSNKD